MSKSRRFPRLAATTTDLTWNIFLTSLVDSLFRKERRYVDYIEKVHDLWLYTGGEDADIASPIALYHQENNIISCFQPNSLYECLDFILQHCPHLKTLRLEISQWPDAKYSNSSLNYLAWDSAKLKYLSLSMPMLNPHVFKQIMNNSSFHRLVSLESDCCNWMTDSVMELVFD